MNSTALAIIQPDELDTIQRTGRMLAASGYFDAKGDGPQAVAMMATKILAGREMGFGPFASVNGVHIINGKPSIGANLMASAVKSRGRYNYKIIELTAKICRIEFYEREGEKWVSAGVSEYTIDEAPAELKAKPVWKAYPKNMLFARALSNGVRWYCPDVFSGNAVYVPEELGADVDGDGNVIEVTPRRVDTSTGEILDPYRGAPAKPANMDVDFYPIEVEPPTDEENDILATWSTPEDAKVWAVNVGACENEFEAKNSLGKIVQANGGHLTKKNMAAILLLFLRRQMEKLDMMAQEEQVPVVA